MENNDYPSNIEIQFDEVYNHKKGSLSMSNIKPGLLPKSDKEMILVDLKKLFCFFFNSNKSKLSFQNFKKLVCALKLTKSLSSNINLIWKASITTNKLIAFEDFCRLILNVAKTVYKNKDAQIALYNLYNNYLSKFISKMSYFDKNLIYNKINSLIENNKLILISLESLKLVYADFFLGPEKQIALKSSQYSEEVMNKKFGKFCKEFNICPKLISLSKCQEIFYIINSTFNIENISIFEEVYGDLNTSFTILLKFTFMHFILSLNFITIFATLDNKVSTEKGIFRIKFRNMRGDNQVAN